MSTNVHERILSAVEEGVLEKLDLIAREVGTTLRDYRAPDGSTVLHYSASHGPAELTHALVKAGVGINVQRADGFTAIHIASAMGRLSTVETLLLAPQIDDTLKDNREHTAIEVSKSRHIEAAFQYARSCFVAATMAELFNAVQKGDADKIRKCMDSNRARNLVDINETDSSGETLLHRAVKSGKIELVQACLAAGADPFAKNRKGKLPLETTPSHEIKQLLKEGKNHCYDF
jgi:ankyrin repeat protein